MRKFNINVNGKAYAVEVEEIGGVAQSNAPAAVAVPVATQVAAPVSAGNGTPVKCPMPGLVRKLCFANGATVKENEQIIVLEAMKVETPVVAPKGGVITYSVAEGTNVESEAILCTIA